MTDQSLAGVAKPLHVQRLEKSLELGPFLSFLDNTLNEPINEDVNSSSEDCDQNTNSLDDLNLEGETIDRSRYYNFTSVTEDRRWLQELLIESSDTSDSSGDEYTEEQYRYMLKMHAKQKKIRKKYSQERDNSQFMYYSTGFLSNFDKYPEQQKFVTEVPKKKKEKEKRSEKKTLKKILPKPKHFEEIQDDSYLNYNMDWEEELRSFKDEMEDDFEFRTGILPTSSSKKKFVQKNPEVMAIRRKKVWMLMCKKEIGKEQRARANNHKEMLATCKKTAQLCMRHCRQKAMQSQKMMKETLWRAKRLAREMQSYWKRYDRVERETRRRLEKEAEEQRKMDVEMIEAKRQQRKLNFLITQTELYAHFMSKKLEKGFSEEQIRILSQLEEEINPRLATMDDYDSEVVKAKAQRNAQDAFNNERLRTKQFDLQANSSFRDDLVLSNKKAADEEHPQPLLFRGNLKGYQLRGMNWLANLYDQGISGILADEMGLGKTVQSIAFLCHIAEKYSVWGPFLIISPASTLHNWQQEMERFVPSFKVVPYWGNPNERKILRQFWDQKDMHTKDASFHVVITSYQIVITDFKYFNRIKWQYMILDEAQAIKSTSSVRWKMLLGFSCRNRLLLSGTPIQNSMAELWALLHFIMPTLFDSHDEFNEWFSKDIESHAENKTGIDEKHLSRLHMILKPFMLRRIKKDVENELSDKIEIMVYCPLTTRQKLLYMALKKKIRIEDLLHYTTSGGSDSHSIDRNFTSNLMNLVMQFRKVCNHPELFERRDAKSPLYVECSSYEIPKLVYEECMLSNIIPSKKRIYLNLFYVFASVNLLASLEDQDSLFWFLQHINISPNDLYEIMIGNLKFRWKNFFDTEDLLYILRERRFWHDYKTNRCDMMISCDYSLSLANIKSSTVLQNMVFTAPSERYSTIYTHVDHIYHSMPETMEHRLIRSRTGPDAELCVSSSTKYSVSDQDLIKLENGSTVPLISEFPYIERTSRTHKQVPTEIPRFLLNFSPKVHCKSVNMYCNSRHAQWDWLKYIQIHSWQGMQAIWAKSTNIENFYELVRTNIACVPQIGGMEAASPLKSWSNIIVPDKETLVTDAGKLSVLDNLLKRLKEEGHRVLIYSQMTKMIDLLEEYMWHRKHKYMRLDGSSKISDRRDMVADFQARTDIFVFLLSTRAGGLGINLTAADTVIFYDSDWNPTVDQQAMDRAHRLGQTKQVTVYRLICKGSIEERILQRAREKSEIQRMVISGGNFKPDTLKPKEVVSLLLDDEEIEMKYRQRTEERRLVEEQREREKERDRDRKRKQSMSLKPNNRFIDPKKVREDAEDVWLNVDSCPPSPAISEVMSEGSGMISPQDDSDEALVVDLDQNSDSHAFNFAPVYGTSRSRPVRGHSKRGRPRGSRRTLNIGRPSPPATIDSSIDGIPLNSLWDIGASTSSIASSATATVRRGPGRPRLKPGGPGHQGSRGVSRPRKPARPLPVPIRSGTSSQHAQPNVVVQPSTEFNYYFCEP